MPILQWLTRDEDIRAARHVPYRLLEEVSDLSYGDKRVHGGNVLTSRTLGIIREEFAKIVPEYSGQLVIYGESSRLGAVRLKQEEITFKQKDLYT